MSSTEPFEIPKPSSPVPPLGKLSSVPPRNVWKHEAHDFTPWLAANISSLADELGLGGLKVIATEHRVGPFALDILAETDDERIVIIENQLEASNHTHLGQCITYAAGVGAYAVVWVLPRLLDEHRAALDWLNEYTTDQVHFFGVELSVVRIGDSMPAPIFTVESRPNDWQKAVRSQTSSGGNPDKRPWEVAYAALDALPHGGWTTIADVAELIGTSPGWIGRHFYVRRHEPATIRMLESASKPWRWIRLDEGDQPDVDAVIAELRQLGIIAPDGLTPIAAGHHDAAALLHLSTGDQPAA